MKTLLLFILFSLPSLAQTTVNNFIVKTNLTVSGADVSTKVANIASLAALSPRQDGQKVETLGYYAPGDGGGATFYYSSSSSAATNLGAVIKPVSSGRFILVKPASGSIDITQFGASANDLTIDYQSITNAIAYAEQNDLVVTSPSGRFLVNKMITKKKGTWLGVRSDSTRVPVNSNEDTVLVTTNWSVATDPAVIDLVTDGPGTGAPYLRNISVESQRTNTITKAPIVAVSSRTSITVPASYLTTFNTVSPTRWPYYGFLTIYSPQGFFLGTTLVESYSTSGTNYVLTLKSDADWFATPQGTSGLLTTNCFVVLAPYTSTTSGDRHDAFAAGVSGFRIRRGYGATLANCAARTCFVGFNFAPGDETSSPYSENLLAWGCAFAGIGNGVRDGFGPGDGQMNGVLFTSGGGGGTAEFALDNEQYCRTTFGFYNLMQAFVVNEILADFCVNGMWFGNNKSWTAKNGLLSNISENGIIMDDGNYNLGDGETTRFNSLRIAGMYSSSTTNSPDSRAVWFRGATYRNFLSLGFFEILTGPVSKFAYAFDITNATANRLVIGHMPLVNSWTNWITTNSLAPIISASEITPLGNRQVGFFMSPTRITSSATEFQMYDPNGVQRMLLDSSAYSIYMINGTGRAFRAGTSSARLFGGSSEEWTGVFDSTGLYVGGRGSGIAGDYGANVVYEQSASGGNNTFMLATYGSTENQLLFRQANGSYASPTATTTGNKVMTLRGRGYDGSAYVTLGNIELEAVGTIGAGNRGSLFGITLVPNGSTTSRRVVEATGDGVKIAPAGVSSSVAASSAFELESTTKGFLPPRMTTTQADAISSPAAGLILYDTSVGKPRVHSGTRYRYFVTELVGSQTWDIPNTAAQSEQSTTVTVTGAAVGSPVLITPSRVGAGFITYGVVTSADTVTIYAFNASSGPIDPASQTFGVKVLLQ